MTMKKYFSILVMLLTGFAFTSCYDVPEPYGIYAGNLPDEEEVIIEPSGSGTVADPYNVAGLLKAVANLAPGESTSAELVVKGIVSQVKNDLNTDFGNLSYYISDDGKTAEQFYVYRGLGLNGEKFTSNEQVATGDVVVVQGTVKNYNGTLEFDQNKSKLLSTTNTSGDGGETVDILGDVTFYEETFASSLGEFTTDNVQLPTGSTRVWAYSDKYKCASASGYVSGSTLASEGWLISPVINLKKATEAYLTFDHNCLKFNVDAATQCAVMVKADNEQVWTQLEIPEWPTGSFVTIANINLSSYVGRKVQVAYKYTSTTASAGTWEVKNFKLTGFGEKGFNGTTWEDFTNGDFTIWDAAATKPVGWQEDSAIGDADLERSEDCMSSPYSCVIKGSTAISRSLAYQALGFEAGTTVTFLAKAASDPTVAPSQMGASAAVRAGCVVTGEEKERIERDAAGKAVTHTLGEQWEEISYTFTLDPKKDGSYYTVAIFIRNMKSVGKDLLIDDVRITKAQ